MSQRTDELKFLLKKLKSKILELEKAGTKLSEQDTRQGLINPVFGALGWDFTDFESIKSEVRHKDFNEPVDYAFYSKQNKQKPVLLLEAKSLGTDVNKPKVIKQLCTYMGEMGVQWGLVTDGNRYVMYNSNSGMSFEDQKFMSWQIKTFDTDDGMPLTDLAEKLLGLLGRECLENDDIQKVYESHATTSQIQNALNSLMTTPFDTLAGAIRKEFKQDRVKTHKGLRITTKQIIEYLEQEKDDEGKIQFGNDAGSSGDIIHEVATLQEEGANIKNLFVTRNKRITILDLLKAKLLKEGQSLRFEYKGEVSWGRVTGNGEIEVNGKIFPTPSAAGKGVTGRECSGWDSWQYKNSNSGKWVELRILRNDYKMSHLKKAS